MKMLHMFPEFFDLYPSRLVFEERPKPGSEAAPQGEPKGGKSDSYEAKAKAAAMGALTGASSWLSRVKDSAAKTVDDAVGAAKELPGAVKGHVEKRIDQASDYVADRAMDVDQAVRGKAYEAGEAYDQAVDWTADQMTSTNQGVRQKVARAEGLAREGVAYGRAGVDLAQRRAGEAKDYAVGKGKEAVAAVLDSSVVKTAAGLGIMTGEAVAALGRGGVEWTSDKLNKGIDWAKFAANYVKDGVVDKAALVAGLGVGAAKFIESTVASGLDSARTTGRKLVAYGEKIYDVATTEGLALAKKAEGVAREGLAKGVAYGRAGVDLAQRRAGEAKDYAVGKGKEAVAAVLDSETLKVAVGLGLIAKEKVATLVGEKKDAAITAFNAAVNWAKFQKDFVVDGVVNQAQLANKFLGEKARFVELTVANSMAEARATGKHLVQKGKEIYDTTTAPGRELLAQAELRGAEALGTGRTVEPTLDTAVAKAPRSPAATLEARAEKPAPRVIVVKPGQSPWSIAQARYGDGNLYGELLKANNLPLDHVLQKGQDLMLPATLGAVALKPLVKRKKRVA